MGCEEQNPSSFANMFNQMASQVHLARALYSDSQEDLEVEFCFLEDHEMRVDPLVKR